MLLGAAAGVKLDRQGDKLEKTDDSQRDRADHQEFPAQRGAEEENARDHDEVRYARRDLRGGREGLPDVHHGVAGLVLDGVAGLVSGDAQGGEAGAVIVVGRQRELPGHGIVVVGQLAGHLDDFDVGDAGGADDSLGRLATGDATARADLGIPGVGAADFHLGVEPEEHGNDDEEDPD